MGTEKAYATILSIYIYIIIIIIGSRNNNFLIKIKIIFNYNTLLTNLLFYNNR